MFSAGFVILDGDHYLLTAGHAIEDWGDHRPLFIEGKESYFSVSGKGVLTYYEQATRVDVAFIRLLDWLLPFLLEKYGFGDLGKLNDPAKLEIYNCCVYGFDENLTFSAVYFCL